MTYPAFAMSATKGQESSPGENSGAVGGGSGAVEPTGSCDASRRAARSLLETYLPLAGAASGGAGWGCGVGRGGAGGYGVGPHRGRFGGGGETEGRPVATQLEAGVPSASSSEAAP
jgi:hypothetical protein